MSDPSIFRNSPSNPWNTTDPNSVAASDMNNQVEAIFTFATEGILITNAQGLILRVNPSIERMFGYKSEELVGKPIEILIPTRFHDRHVHHRNNFAPQPRAMGLGFDLYAMRKDQSEFPVEVSLSPYDSTQGRNIIAFIIDITIRKQAESQLLTYKSQLEKEVEERTLILKEAIKKLENTKSELDQSLKRERELNTMKSRFISIASHEFRTPLATVLSSLSLVEKYADLQQIESRNRHIQRIKSSIKHLTEMLNDMLAVNKVEEGKVVLQVYSFPFLHFLEEIQADLVGILKKGQVIHTEFLFPPQAHILSDPKILRPILMNLLGNAIKFSSENQSIRFRVAQENDQWTIAVQDQGIGIPKEDQSEIFNRFYRSSNASNIQGTGLGLNIVFQYVQLLGGSIRFESQENAGTTFYIQIPSSHEKNIAH
ncbi:MAG: ATP-binding protein [Spirosomataceae bacterium]